METTQRIPWDDSYAINIEGIDTQHKKLFELVNRLYDLDDSTSTKEDLRLILYEFNDYMKVHFSDEEAYMLKIAYPSLDEHKKLHEDIIETFTKVIKAPASLSLMKVKIRMIAKRALIDHILHEDSKIKLFLFESKVDENIYDISDL